MKRTFFSLVCVLGVLAAPFCVSAEVLNLNFSVVGDVASDTAADFSFSANPDETYSLSLLCPLGITVASGTDVCKNAVLVPPVLGTTTHFSVSLKNETTIDQSVVATLVAFGMDGTELRRQSAHFRINASPLLKASLSSFTVDPLVFDGATGLTAIAARFSGKNVDTYHIQFTCPEPSTVAGVRERLLVIASPRKDAGLVGDRCGETQTLSASLDVFTFKYKNPFKTPQALSVILEAYGWDGEKEVLGEARSQTVSIKAQ